MKNVVGIDLGTTFSALAILNVIGRPDIIPNDEGERITPSAIYFGEDNNTISVGIEAINSRQLNPARAVRWIKRHMGTDYRTTIDGRDWTPVEMSSLILAKLKQDASAQCGEIQDVAISVPAHFDELRRKATMDAGALAGLNVISIVNEPVAAALYYATKNDVSGRVLVYDLGGGTFDVTIIDVKGHQMDIVCSQGDHALGGIDFDQRIVKIFERAYKAECGGELIETPEDRAKYEDEAEDVKKTLSRRPAVKKILYGPSGTARVEITREMFEEAIAPLIGRTEMLVETALAEAQAAADGIDKVLLVGGSTRIPMVSRSLERMFGFAPEVSVNVDESVALGAALHAGLTLLREEPESVAAGIAGGLADVKLQDVCNQSYGTLSAPRDAETGQRILANTIVLRKNTPLPCQANRTFYTMENDQDRIQIAITQGEDTDPRFVNILAQEVFELPDDCPAGHPISVNYSYDLNQRMHCRFEDAQSGKSLEVELAVGETEHSSPLDADRRAGEVAAFTVK